VLSVRATVVSLPAQFDGFSRAVLAEVRGTRTDLSAKADGITVKADDQLTALRKDTLAEVREWRTTADRQLTDALGKADARLSDITATLGNTATGIREDLKPVLADADETLQQASGTIAVIRPQALGLIAASKVTAGETAQAARRIDTVLPEYLGLGAKIGANIDGVSTDVHTFTTRFVAPKPWYRRVWSAVVTGLDIVF
jgi:ElaB/YqjD/DUF883 family membrane-anchored ribosome-binding protein